MEDRPGVLHCNHLRGYNQEGEGLLGQRGSQGGCRVQDISVASCSHGLSSSVSWPAPLHPPNYRRSVSISTNPKQMVSERKQWLAQRALSICSQGRLLWLQVRPGLVLLLLVTSQQSSGNGVNRGSQFSLCLGATFHGLLFLPYRASCVSLPFAQARAQKKRQLNHETPSFEQSQLPQASFPCWKCGQDPPLLPSSSHVVVPML